MPYGKHMENMGKPQLNVMLLWDVDLFPSGRGRGLCCRPGCSGKRCGCRDHGQYGTFVARGNRGNAQKATWDDELSHILRDCVSNLFQKT